MDPDFSSIRIDTAKYELLAVISNLEKAIIQLTSDVKALNTRMDSLEKRMNEYHESIDDIDKITHGN